MRISDWSSDVCSSDLGPFPVSRPLGQARARPFQIARTGRETPGPVAADARILGRDRGRGQACADRRMDQPVLRLTIFSPPLQGRGSETCELARRSEEHTSELQSLMRIPYAVFCLKKKNTRSNEQVQP